jgi:hypothetical protein
MTHDITEARIEAVAKSLWRLGDCPTPYDITRTILEADARWLAEQLQEKPPTMKRVPFVALRRGTMENDDD